MSEHYKVVSNNDHEALAAQVNLWCDKGWRVQGGLTVRSSSPQSIDFYQAMVPGPDLLAYRAECRLDATNTKKQ